MARISGVNIPTNKKVHIALTYIFGIGNKFATDICNTASIDISKRVSELTDDNGVLYTLSDLENNTYLFRRYRDFSYLALAGFYLLQIVDANVDAHLRFFDSNDDLSFSVLPPYSKFITNDVWQVGINLKLR